MESRFSPEFMRGIVWGLWGAAAVLVVSITYKLLFSAPQDPGQETFPALQSSDVVKAPGGHAYRYVLAPNITWAGARDASARYAFEGRAGYLATTMTRPSSISSCRKCFRVAAIPTRPSWAAARPRRENGAG